jgi:hypothetical protein
MSTTDFINSKAHSSEVPEFVKEEEDIRSESKRMLNRLLANQEPGQADFFGKGPRRGITPVPLEPGASVTRPSEVLKPFISGVLGLETGKGTETYRTGQTLAEMPPVKAAAAIPKVAGEAASSLAALPALSGMVRLGGKKPDSKPISIFTPLPKADAPFVGRLDTFVAELPGPVRKDQFLGSLQGRFRDYEIGRAKEALRDLTDDAKLSPVDLLNRIKQRYDPAYYRTQVIEPRPNSFYYQMDNVYKGPVGNEFPLGVIHLIQADSPQNSSKVLNEKLEKMINRTYGGWDPEELTETRSDLLNIFGSLSNVDKRKLARSWTSLSRAEQELGVFEQTKEYLLYPYINFTESIPASSMTPNAMLTKIIQNAAETAKNRHGVEGIEAHLPNLIQEHLGKKSGEEAYNAVRDLVDKKRQELYRKTSDSNDEFRYTLRDIKNKYVENYRGQHATLGGENNPIAFSRFSEHTTDIPGLGTTKGIYVNELQSDRLGDIRTQGPYGGSAQKDLATRVIPLREQQARLLEQFIKLKSKGAPSDQLSAASKQLSDLNEKLEKATKRVMEGTYSIRESFPGMEESPQVIQQLMAKNVISAAINRGVNFVAFPGAESKQAQLYEKLPNNLKQVVKDLGPGFELRPVTLKTPNGQDMTHFAVVWGPEAANRIKQKGVPFKDGGPVDVSRETSTSKKLLDTLSRTSQRKRT